jgi:chemotaxis-related protein WspB
MLLILFHIGNNLYAIETNKLIEIVPMVMLRSIQSARNFVVGIFNYRGRIIPAVDLCYLMSGKPSQICYSTRIMIVQTASDTRPIGLIAERVSETLKVSIAQTETTEVINDSSYLGKLLLTDQGMIQLIDWEALALDALETEKDGVKSARLD